MKLAAPEWLLLLPALIVAAWLWPHFGLKRPLRALCLGLVVLILSAPMLRRAADGIDLWVLADRSASAAGEMANVLPEWEGIIDHAKGPGDQLHFIDFAATPTLRNAGEITVHDVNETRTALALQYTLGQLSRDRLARILILTDGYSTEPLTGITEPLVKSGIPVDFRLLPDKGGADFQVSGIDAPQRVQMGESFIVEARVNGTKDAEFEGRISRDGQEIGHAPIQIHDGRGRVRFSDRLATVGAHRYTVRILPTEDAHPENNESEAWVEVAGGSRVLVVTAYEHDPVAETLQSHGFAVQQVTDLSQLNAGSFTGTRLVILNNVPAFRLPDDFIHGLDFFVREQAGGLLMCGGKFSFGSGGYFSSPVDPLLPVSMELRKEHRKLRVAMAVVMDRSGSMAVSVPGAGGTTMTKMDLADEGAARTAELLSDSDLLAVIAVDTEAHRFVPLTEVGPSRKAIENKARRIQSEGGGIYIDVALKAAWEELKKADVGQRHVILFSDANDSEQGPDHRKIVESMAADGITVSVIGMGTPHDSDAGLLMDIAAHGNGRIEFCSNVSELPAMFAQETVAVARSAFIKDPTPLKPTPGWLEIASSPLSWPANSDGYNLSYLRPGATAAAVSGDEYTAPLVAFWQRGLGRTAAVSFPLAGEYSETARQWPQYADLVTTLGHWLSGEDVPAGLGLQSRLVGTDLDLDFFYDGTEWTQRVTANEPLLVLGSAKGGEPRTIPWERLAPGHFHARTPLRPGELVRGVTQIGKSALPFGPILAESNVEWQFRKEAVSELRALSAMTGGRERLDLSTSWEAPHQDRFSEMRPWLLAVLLVLVVIEALLTRLGWPEAPVWRR